MESSSMIPTSESDRTGFCLQSFTLSPPSYQIGDCHDLPERYEGAQDVVDGKSPTLAGVKAVDDHTLTITIDKRKPFFLAKLTYPTAYVVCKEAVDKNGGLVNENAMIGTGPFMLKKYELGYKVTLLRTPDTIRANLFWKALNAPF